MEGNNRAQKRPAPIKRWLEKAQNIQFDGEPSRYHETGRGYRVYTELDETSPHIKFQINRTKYQGIPPAELNGNIGTSFLSPGQGLLDTWYAIAFDTEHLHGQATVLAITTKGTRAPNNLLRNYLRDKFPDESQTLTISQLAHKDILKRISHMNGGTLLEIAVKPAHIHAIRAVNESMADAFQASQDLFPQSELTQTIKPATELRPQFLQEFLPLIAKLLSNRDHNTAVTKLRFGGFYGQSNKTTIINLLSNDLSVEVQIPTNDPTFTTFDSTTVYAELQQAYEDIEPAIREATEVAEWPSPTDGTNDTLLPQTPLQQELFR